MTDVRLPRRSGLTTAFLARNFNVKRDALANTDGTILLIFPVYLYWYFGALIFSVVNAAAKRRSKLAFDRSQLSDEELLLLLLLDENSSENPQFSYEKYERFDIDDICY